MPVFLAACRLPAEQREDFVKRRSKGRPEIEREVFELLEEDQRETGDGLHEEGLDWAKDVPLGNREQEAAALHREVLSHQRRLLGETHHDTVFTMYRLGTSELSLHRNEEARQQLEGALRLAREHHPGDPVLVPSILNALAIACTRSSDLTRAEEIFAESLARIQERLPEDHWMIGAARLNHGSVLMDLGRLEEAEGELLAGFDLLDAALDPDHERRRAAIQRLISLYTLRKDSTEATYWREQLEESAP